jgi:hypothetical protein
LAPKELHPCVFFDDTTDQRLFTTDDNQPVVDMRAIYESIPAIMRPGGELSALPEVPKREPVTEPASKPEPEVPTETPATVYARAFGAKQEPDPLLTDEPARPPVKQKASPAPD